MYGSRHGSPRRPALTAAALAVLLAAAPGAARAALIASYADFSSTAGLTLNGNAAQAGNVLRVTPDVQGQAGSAFLSSATTLHGFSTTFQFQISGSLANTGSRSDGLAFLIHSDPRGASALGLGGGNIGYGDDQGTGQQITPSVIVEFDTHAGGGDPSDSHVGLMLNGNRATHLQSALLPDPFKLDNGSIKTATITYDEASTTLSVLLGQDPTAPGLLFSHVIDLGAVLGPQVYFGFSSGTGGGRANHDVLNWQLQVPAPAVAGLLVLGLGLAGLGRAARGDGGGGLRCWPQPSRRTFG